MDDHPQDVRTVTALTVEQAKHFAKNADSYLALEALTTLSPEAAAALVANLDSDGTIEFGNLKTVSPETCAALAEYDGWIYFWALTSISADAARAIATHNGSIRFEALEHLTEEAAAALAEHAADLYVPSLRRLSPDLAQKLASQGAWCDLVLGVSELSAEAAWCLACYEGDIYLYRLNEISDEVAESLGTSFPYSGSRNHSFEGLATLTPSAAAFLVANTNGFSLGGLKSLTAETAWALAQHQGEWLALESLATVSVEIEAALSQHAGSHLVLSGLTSLKTFALAEKLEAQAVSQHEIDSWNKVLDQLTELGKDAAIALSRRKAPLSLASLSTVTPDVAELLAAIEAPLSLNGLRSPLADDVAKALAKHKGELSLGGLTTMSCSVAAALSKHPGKLLLDGLTSPLGPDVAAALAVHKGWLSLNGLSSLTAETAHALSSHVGYLQMNGVSEIYPDVATELAASQSYIAVNDVATLCDDTAEALARFKGCSDSTRSVFRGPDLLSLFGLTSLSVRAFHLLRQNSQICLPKHGFIINLRRSGHCILRHDIPFTVGAEYFRDALLDFSGSQQNREGIIYGDAAPGFLICTSGGHHQERYGYEDRPIPGGLGWHYFGQGANGNQRLDFRGNAMLTTAQRVVMFFTAREQTPEEQEASSSKRKLYRFEGFFRVGAWEWFVPRTGIRRGDRLIRYRLVPLSSAFDDTGD